MLFVVRLPNGADPASFTLTPLDSKSDSRHTRQDPKNRNAPLGLSFKVTKVGPSSYGLTPASDLAPGEYAFSPSTSNDAYCFGVDPAAGEKPN